MSIRRFLLASMLAVVTAFSTVAQESNQNFGDNNQPGNRLHSNIVTLVAEGNEQLQAINSAIDSSVSETDNTLNGDAKGAIAFDIPLANQFYIEMMQSNSLIDVTKVLIETNPAKVVHVITLGVTLYPDYTQDIYDGAALTGVMLPEDVLVAIIQAGADPTSVSNATAAGLPAAGNIASIVPLGAGIGAGGTGGGDTTASTN